MTNQNDTQDEAERMAEACCNRARSAEIILSERAWHRVKAAYVEAYRAGQASREHELDLSEQDFKFSTEECKALRAEVERLKADYANLKKSHDSYQSGEGNLFLDKVGLLKQLVAEKSRANTLIEIIKEIIPMLREAAKTSQWNGNFLKLAVKCEFALANYSSDSGDGSGK